MKKLLFLFVLLSFNGVFASFLWNKDAGVQMLKDENYIDAYNFFVSYINNNPNDEDAWYYEGLALSKLQSKQKARSSFQKSYEISSLKRNLDKLNFEDTSNIEDYVDIAAMYFEQKNYKNALDYSNIMLEIDPACALAYFIKAKVFCENKEFQSAKEMLNIAIYLDDSYLDTNLAKSLEINSKSVPEKSFLSKIAVYKYYQGDIEGAKSYLESYLELEKNVDIYSLLIDCYLKEENIQKAQSILSEAKKVQENSLILILEETKIQELEGKDIKQTLQKGYKINPNNEDLLLKLGNYYLDKKNYEEALTYYQKLINMDNTYYDAYFGYIYSLLKLQKNESALKAIRQMIALNKDNSETDYLLSKLCQNKANYSEALTYIKQAQKKEKNIYYTRERAKINYMLGNWQKSINNLNKIPNSEEDAELKILNYIQLKDISNISKSIETLDKNSIMYKYYLYIISKLEGRDKEAQVRLSEIKKIKPKTEKEYYSLIKIAFLNSDAPWINKLTNAVIKKYGNSPELSAIRIEGYYILKDYTNLKEVLKLTAQLYQ